MTDPIQRKNFHPKKIVNTKRFIPLRYRFILITSVMLLLLLSTLAIVLGELQTRTIRSRIEKQGLAISKNLAAISVDYLVTYNYIVLEKLVNQAAGNFDTVYVIIHDKEGRVAGYSGRPDLQNKILSDSVSIDMLEKKEPAIKVHKIEGMDKQVMEVVVPVYLPDKKNRWGTIRVCLSLELMHRQIRQTHWTIFILGFIALALGIFISNWVAQRVTEPLEKLVKATVKAADGDLKQQISIRTRDEVEILSSNFSIMIREILAQKELLENQLYEIRQLQQYSEKILDTMSDGLLAVDMDGIVVTANPAAYTILDIPFHHKVKGRHVFELFDNDIAFTTYVQKSLDNPSNQRQQEIRLKKGEETRVLLTGAGVLESDKKTPRQIIFNINNITALKKLEAKIIRNQRLADLGVLAAGMAHEIRNPLSAIKTYVALLPAKIERQGFLDKFQRTVPREINRLNNLAEQLLELSRQPKYYFIPTDIGQLLKQSIELLEADFNAQGVDCQLIIPKTLPKIVADADQLKKVFINLMQNGAQAMPEGGVITINIYCKDTFVILDFQDTGHGFSPELSENIFNPFFTTKNKGTGLGLAITHKVILDHEGLIEAKSIEGQGCCFSISLPQKKNQESAI